MTQHSNLAGRPNVVVVVVVADDAAVCKSLKFSLEVDGFSVRTYERAEELLSETIFPACGCLVIDQKLPGISGTDLIAALCKRNVSAPALLITTHPTSALKNHAASICVPIVEKPLLGSALLDGINQAMKRPTPPPY